MTSTASTPQAPKGHILVAEDDARSRRLLCDLLIAQDYRVSEAVNGEEALQAVCDAPPDVVLLDVMMPKMDGMEVCRRLKAKTETAPIPVLLVTALHERSDRIKGIACGANDFITKPVDTEEVLLRVRNALNLKRIVDQRDQLLRMREDLSDMIVHDIRNPLISIMLSVRRLMTMPIPDPASALTKGILGQANVIDKFVSDLMDISRMEQGEVIFYPVSVELPDLIRTVIEDLRPQTDYKHIEIKAIAPEGSCTVQVDKRLFTRLLDNLLANAIKYSPKNSTIVIRVCPKDEGHGCCKIIVEDEGPGVPPQYRETIFDKYSCVRMKDSPVRQIGLGLTFCRMTARAHGGRIYVEERQPQGSAFVVELP